MHGIVAFLLCVLCLHEGAHCGRFFRNGRAVGGNLGKPRPNNLYRKGIPNVQEEWFTQNLDHFSPTDETTWQQRYFSNDQFFNATLGGAVFLSIGGEGEASKEWMTLGSWIDYAHEYGALLFQLEHRYYGKSHPTEDLSTENLKYLSSEQALADLATFIPAMNEKHGFGPNVKWIAFGGSYPGSLAAWLRYKYAHLVHGSMSSSGPLLAEVDFKDYFKVVADSLATSSGHCVTAVQHGFAQISILLKKKIGQENLNTLFKTCTPLQESVAEYPSDVSNFYANVADNFAGVVQYNKDNRIGKSKASNITINDLCDIMTNQSIGPPVDRLGKVNSLLLDANDEKCLDYKYDKMIEEMRDVSWGSKVAEGSRQWTYQTCTEFGFFQTSASTPHIFGEGFPVDFYTRQCADVYGASFDRNFLQGAVNRTNTLYGALELEVSNVVFVHGSIDPWHALGIIRSGMRDAPAIYVDGVAHCANMYPPADTDPPQLVEARREVGKLIGSWLNEPHKALAS